MSVCLSADAYALYRCNLLYLCQFFRMSVMHTLRTTCDFSCKIMKTHVHKKIFTHQHKNALISKHILISFSIPSVSRRPSDVTDAFLSSLDAIWRVCCPDRRRATSDVMDVLPERREISPQFRNFDEDEQVWFNMSRIRLRSNSRFKNV